ncbi:hypothetical protein NIES2104_52920 [Leptolyngbya sp. NIES-2104]|nr:hypothetical protein NIES2104_52920 [Leptolyngbya sp. NIES-2104]
MGAATTVSAARTLRNLSDRRTATSSLQLSEDLARSTFSTHLPK